MRVLSCSVALSTLIACTGEKLDTGTEADPLVGRTYEVEIGDGEVEGADDLAETIETVLTAPVLAGITAEGGGSIDLRLGLGVAGSPVAQDLCARTLDLPTGSFDGTNIDIGPETVEFNASGTDYTLDDFEVHGALSADGNSIEDMTMAMTIDMVQAAAYLGSDSGEDVCENFVEPLGLSCQDCGGGSSTCLSVTMTGVPADRVDLTLEKVVASNAAEGCEG